MAGKPPKVKSVPTPGRTPDPSGDGFYRPPSPLPSTSHLLPSHRLDPSQPSNRTTIEQIALTQTAGVKVSPMLSAIDGFAVLPVPSSLADYWIPKSQSLGEPDAQGIRMFKQRQYVAVDDVHFVQVALDAESGFFRATLARELNPSGPILKPDGEGRFWLALDSSDSPGHAPLPVYVDPASVQKPQTGGLRGGADNNPTLAKSVVERVQDLYPQLSSEEVTTFINQRLQRDSGGILTRLEKELATLRGELAIWCASEASPHSESSVQQSMSTPVGQRQAREQFSAKLQEIWQRKSVSRWGYGDYHFSSDIDFFDDLPTLSARFEYVTELILTAKMPGPRIGAFLDSFPNVQYLMVTGVKMEDFSPGIFQMRELRQLKLNDCSLELTAATAEGISRIETLTLLNLSNNPLTTAPHVGFMPDLTELMLYDAGISKIPSGIDVPKQLRVLALQENNISDVGDELLDIPDTQDLFVGLVNNPLSNASKQRVAEYLDNSSMDRKMDIQMDEPFSEVDSDSESSDSDFGTGSDSD